MLRCFLLLVLLGVLAGCAKKMDLPETTVSAADGSDFSRARSELGAQFPAEQLQPFDTAVQELRLDAMNRDVVSSEARELDMLAVVNGKSVQAVTLLGWQARHARFLREIAVINRLLESDLKLQQKAGANGPSSTVLARIQSAKNLIAQLQGNAAETERRLTELRSTANQKK
jgi:hypothetical protein